jgi:hypothetical protein
MQVDPRGLRFGATLTTVVLVIVLVTGSWGLLAAQAVIFAIGAAFGPRYAPYGMLFQRLVRPRLGPPEELEAVEPPRFAQGVGCVFVVVGAVGYGLGMTTLGVAVTVAALVAAFLNAAFEFCLGCEMYLLIRRITGSKKEVHA